MLALLSFVVCSLFCRTSIRQTSRKGFLSEGVPVALRGITGPGAPHLFEFDRRQSLCPWAALVGFSHVSHSWELSFFQSQVF